MDSVMQTELNQLHNIQPFTQAINHMKEAQRWELFFHQVQAMGERIAAKQPFLLVLHDRTPQAKEHHLLLAYTPASKENPFGHTYIEVPDDPNQIPTLLHAVEAIVVGIQKAHQAGENIPYPEIEFRKRHGLLNAVTHQTAHHRLADTTPVLFLPLEIDPEHSNTIILPQSGKGYSLKKLVQEYYTILQQDRFLLQQGWRHTMLRQGVQDRKDAYIILAQHVLTKKLPLLPPDRLTNDLTQVILLPDAFTSHVPVEKAPLDEFIYGRRLIVP